jgi:hypothetical protein
VHSRFQDILEEQLRSQTVRYKQTLCKKVMFIEVKYFRQFAIKTKTAALVKSLQFKNKVGKVCAQSLSRSSS